MILRTLAFEFPCMVVLGSACLVQTHASAQQSVVHTYCITGDTTGVAWSFALETTKPDQKLIADVGATKGKKPKWTAQIMIAGINAQSKQNKWKITARLVKPDGCFEITAKAATLKLYVGPQGNPSDPKCHVTAAGCTFNPKIRLKSTGSSGLWSPRPMFATTHGKGYQYLFGCYPAGHWQFADGNLRNTALLLTKVSMRVQNRSRNYSDYYRMGRAWSNVKIDIAPTNLATFKSNFSINMTSTPTQCYSGPMTWPTQPVGQSAGGLNNMPIQAPLTTPYINSGDGKDDMLLDFRFTGGSLANNMAWGSSATRYYYTDGYLVTSFVNGPQRFFHDPTSRGCIDSKARPLFYRSYTYQYVYRYAASYRSTSFRNKLRVYNYTYNTAPSKSFINAVDFQVNSSGVPFGSSCEKLYLAGTPAMLLYPGAANAVGYGGQNLMGFLNGLLPYNPVFLGVEVFTQSVWNDSVTGAMKLSAASSGRVADFGIESNDAARRKCLYFYNTTSPTGNSAPWFYANPIIRYN